MSYTEAQKRAVKKYLQEKTDDIRLRVRKGTKDKWKHYADLSGKSLTAYVCDAVDRQIISSEGGENIPAFVVTGLISWLKEHGHTDEEILDCLHFRRTPETPAPSESPSRSQA